MRASLHDLIEQRANSGGARPALQLQATTLTYGELWNRVLAMASGLRRLGVTRQERVAIYLDKRIETVTSFFGVSRAGAVFVPINPLLRGQQVGYILGDCDVRVLITTPERYAQLRDDLGAAHQLQHVVLIGAVPPSTDGSGPYLHGWTEICESGDGGATVDSSRGIDLDMAAIFYTSGSTGRPKGVVLSHRNLDRRRGKRQLISRQPPR